LGADAQAALSPPQFFSIAAPTQGRLGNYSEESEFANHNAKQSFKRKKILRIIIGITA
jgi:hypothetical protein